MALRTDREGLNAPAPPLHVPPLAPPPIEPASWACGLPAHSVWSGPAFAVAAGLITMRTSSLAARHGPVGSLVVSVRVTAPAAISAAVGVYTAFSDARPGLKE